MIMSLARYIGIALFAFMPLSHSEDADWLEYANGLLSVRFEGTPLSRALERLTEQTGVEFSLQSNLEDEDITVSYNRLSLQKGIQQLLNGYNYVMLYRNSVRTEDNVEKVVLLNKVQKVKSGPDLRTARQGLPPRQPQSAVVLQKQGSGHFIASGAINHYPVEFLIDTGATLTVVPGDIAHRMGLDNGSEMTVNTANGPAKGYQTTLNSISIGDLTVTQVPALILPDMAQTSYVLLGMSFLGSFDMATQENTLVIRRRQER